MGRVGGVGVSQGSRKRSQISNGIALYRIDWLSLYEYKGQAFSHGTPPGWLKLVLKETLEHCNRNTTTQKIFSSGAALLQ